MAVGALNTGPVGRLRAVTASVAELIAVTALNFSHVARLGALLGDVALLVAVAAGHDTLLLALLRAVALLTTVAADIRLAVRAVAGEVAHLAAVLALDVVHVRRLRAFLGHVPLLTAVTATTTTLLGRLLAVTGTVTDLVAVDALLDNLVFGLTLLLLALGPGVADLLAVRADDNKAVNRETSLNQTGDVLLRSLRPCSLEDGTPRLGGPLDGDGELLVGLALQVDESPIDGNFLVLGDEVGVELLATERLLQVLECDIANGFGVSEESLCKSVLCKEVRHPTIAHLLDEDRVLLLVCSLESLPSLVRREVRSHAMQGEEAVGLAVSGDVAFLLAGLANLGPLVGTVGPAVTSLTTAAAFAGELTLDGGVRAIRLVVARLVAVVAETGVGALLPLLRAVASEVAVGATAVQSQSSVT